MLRLAAGIGVAGLAALLAARPWTGFVAWMAAMPLANMAHIQVTFGAWQLLPTTVFVGALLLGRIAAGVISRARAERAADGVPAMTPWHPDRTARLAWGVALAIVALTVVSVALAANVSRAIPIALHGVIEPVVLAALVVDLRPTRRQVVAVLVALAAGVVAATVVNVVRLAIIVKLWGNWAAYRSQLGRLTYYNVGIYGNVVVMTLPVVLAIAMAWRPPRYRWLVAAGSLLVFAGLAVGLYFSYSKSAWLGAAVAVPLFLFLVLRTPRQRLAVIAIAVVLSPLALPWPGAVLRPISPAAADAVDSVINRIQPRSGTFNISTTEGEVSVEERVRATKAGVQMAIDHPIFGMGPGGFGPAYNAGPYHDPKATRQLDSPHDFPITLLAETGIVETGLFAAAFLGALYAAFALWRRGDRALGAAFAASIVGFGVVATLFGLDFYRPQRLMNSDVVQIAVLVALPIGLLPALLRREARAASPMSPASLGARSGDPSTAAGSTAAPARDA